MLAVTDERISPQAVNRLLQYGYENISLPAFSALPQPVSAHPDMLFFQFGNKLITHKLYYKEAKRQLDKICDKCGFELALTDENIGSAYPNDVLFNAAFIGNSIIGNLSFISKHIKTFASENGVKLINTRQGYAKCSICVVSDNAIITPDSGIERDLKRNTDIDVLKISEGFVGLNGYNTGFIGGATGTDSENVYFCGDIEYHPDKDKIIKFCNKYLKNAICLTDTPLYDVGTIMLFNKSLK
ncbi:MAG: hypothetical protein IKK24_02210 [Clostridia bacterium]|nr:hypothetical protein [Clostridia bacterium]